MDFRKRSYQKELLDRDDIPFPDILRNMQELNTINHLLGGHAITLSGLKYLLRHNQTALDRPLHIVEIGCGGGDNLRVLKKWCSRKGIAARFTGIDINPDCIETARLADPDMNYIASDYRLTGFELTPDIVFSSLFCHHFTEDALTGMLQWMENHSQIGFFINDLQRHPVAYYSILALTRLFSRSYLVKNDAPLSVLRGFHKKELRNIAASAGIKHYRIYWKWAFRYLFIASGIKADPI